MVSEELDQPYDIPDIYPRGRYLLLFDPFDGSSNIDVNMPVGTIFSVLRCPEGVDRPTEQDFLQPGTAQVAAGFAIYGTTTMMMLTLGQGVHGFTIDPEIGAFTLTHPDMKIPETTREFAVNMSNARFWEPPVRRYVEECVKGASGPREADFNMRWIASMVAEVHRILIRGGLFMYPADSKDPGKPGRLRLMYEANPMAMIVEQAGGAASTGRERMLEVTPTGIHQRVPVILGSAKEVERLVAYHAPSTTRVWSRCSRRRCSTRARSFASARSGIHVEADIRSSRSPARPVPARPPSPPPSSRSSAARVSRRRSWRAIPSIASTASRCGRCSKRAVSTAAS